VPGAVDFIDHERLKVAELSAYCPPAVQLPAEGHDTEVTAALPPWLRAAVPGTSLAVCQVPWAWLTTNAWAW